MLAVLGLYYGLVARGTFHLVVLSGNLGLFGVVRFVSLYRALMETGRATGWAYLFWGAVCFVVATAISFVKGGIFRRMRERLVWVGRRMAR